MLEIQGKNYKLASLSDRFSAQLLDSLIYIGVYLPGIIIGSYPGWAYAIIPGLAVALYYLLFQDGFKNGQSYGKRVLKTKVIHLKSGLPCTFSQSFIRNFLLTILGGIDWLFIFSSKRQRLGDMLAKTVVVYEKNISELNTIEDPEEKWCCPECNSINPNITYVCENCHYSLQ